MTTPTPDDGRTMRERMLAGELYLAFDPEITEANAVATDLMTAYNATTPRQEPLRRVLLEELLGHLGEDTVVRPRCTSTTARRSGSARAASPTTGSWPSTSPRSPSATTCRSAPTSSS